MQYMGALIAVRDMERSLRFYQQLLGLTVEADFGANVALSGGIFLQTAGTWKDFIHRREEEIVFANHAAELYFETDDMDDFIARLAAFPDLVYVHPLTEHAWGQRVLRFYDPDWHIVEVGEKMTLVVKRWLASGLTVEQTAARMDVPVGYILSSLNA